jgi:arsenate reductase-like glutaredoxin family protein
MPTLDIIYCFRNKDSVRVKNSLDTLALQSTKNFKVIFVDYGSDEITSEIIKLLCSKYNFCTYHYIDTQGKLWNRADALNYGFYLSNADYVFTSDIDILFYPTFVEIILASLNEDDVNFYSVGYLSERQTKKIDAKDIVNLKYRKSKDYALGMMLVSKKIITKINGYNTFYAIWGQEDNDIKYRIDNSHFKTKFVDNNIYLLHQYHLPATLTDLPIGWRQFLSDYFENQKLENTNFYGLNAVKFPITRPAKAIFFSETINYKLLNYRKLFIRHQLLNSIIELTPNNHLAYMFNLEKNKIKKSIFIKSIHFFNKVYLKIGWPISLGSIYEPQYISESEVRDEIYFVLKSLENYIIDYYFHITTSTVKLIVIKK